jgi:hypothetical protein
MAKINEHEVIALLKSFDKPLYWLAVLVANGDISESFAGYLIVTYGIK